MKNKKQVRNIDFSGILSHDDINAMIKKQQTLNKKKQSGNTEYKIINSNEDEDTLDLNNKTVEENKEIEDLSKEVNDNTNTYIDMVEGGNDDNHDDEHLDTDKINDLKKEVMGSGDEDMFEDLK